MVEKKDKLNKIVDSWYNCVAWWYMNISRLNERNVILLKVAVKFLSDIQNKATKNVEMSKKCNNPEVLAQALSNYFGIEWQPENMDYAKNKPEVEVITAKADKTTSEAQEWIDKLKIKLASVQKDGIFPKSDAVIKQINKIVPKALREDVKTAVISDYKPAQNEFNFE